VADNLPSSSADVMEFGSLNLPEPSGPHRPVMAILYLIYVYIYTYIHIQACHLSADSVSAVYRGPKKSLKIKEINGS
jgi:hypothetical protein